MLWSEEGLSLMQRYSMQLSNYYVIMNIPKRTKF